MQRFLPVALAAAARQPLTCPCFVLRANTTSETKFYLEQAMEQRRTKRRAQTLIHKLAQPSSASAALTVNLLAYPSYPLVVKYRVKCLPGKLPSASTPAGNLWVQPAVEGGQLTFSFLVLFGILTGAQASSPRRLRDVPPRDSDAVTRSVLAALQDRSDWLPTHISAWRRVDSFF